MKIVNLGTGFFMIGLVLSLGCAGVSNPASPEYFPNEHYKRVGEVQLRADESYCRSLADDYIKEPSVYEEMLKQGGVGAVVGAGTGAVAGTITKSKVGRATAAGAAVGGIVGVLKGLSESNVHNPSYERFVERCLQEKGYEVVGWRK